MDEKENKISFRDSLNLPKTDFPIRANVNENEPKILKRWYEENLDKKTFYCHEGNEKYIFHFGPPYANGHIHAGTAYATLLKDILCKSKRMTGMQVPVQPGWDCHGLPIELKVTQENPGLDTADLIKKCRAFAGKWVDIQREEFKNLGILFDWSRPYLTMDYTYEHFILKAFGIFVEKGYIERKNKTVPWCSYCETVLASAEIEYKEKKDPSIYVTFELKDSKKYFPKIDKPISFLVWTTTPWTLPLNRAVLLKPKAKYQLLEGKDNLFIVGQELSDTVCKELGIEKKVIADFIAEDLSGAKAKHPFVENLEVPILFEHFVALNEGTACVHCAPGCGPIDYEVGIRNKLGIFSPLSPAGKYIEGIGPKELENMLVTDGQIWVIKKLAEKGKLLHKTSIKHSFPHCWRCRNPLIFRATKQWFCDLTHRDLKQKALNSIESIKFIPKVGYNHMKAVLETRLEWCLSRQRRWGIPIPAIICENCDYAYITKETAEDAAKGIAKEGIEYWNKVDINILIPKDFSCPHCKGVRFRKEKDILDVWFDSGVSHYAVLKHNPELGFPADAYLEAIDQFRGWFQSSLLTSLVIEEEPSMRSIMYHGYTVDAKGQKMSKSIGNVVTPQEMIDKIGRDGVRLWASSLEFEGDAVLSEVLFNNIKEVYRKIRNTCRFLMANLYDFDIIKDAIKIEDMLPVDQYAMSELYRFNEKVRESYDKVEFSDVYHELSDYCSHLSSFYLDVVKDRLYVEKADGLLRRSAQTSCWHILDNITKFMAPILSFTAEQISDHYQKDKKDSIHLQVFPELENIWEELITDKKGFILDIPGFLSNAINMQKKIDAPRFAIIKEQQWGLIEAIRAAVLKALEKERTKGLIKHSLDAKVKIYFDKDMKNYDLLEILFKELENKKIDKSDFLKELFIVSQLELLNTPSDLEKTDIDGLFIKVEKAEGDKCPRCWKWDITEDKNKLCKRCQKVLANIS